MNRNDIISDTRYEKLVAKQKLKEKIEHIAIAVLTVSLFAAACSPVIFQSYFNLFWKGKSWTYLKNYVIYYLAHTTR